MTTITVEVPDELAANLDLGQLPGLLHEIVERNRMIRSANGAPSVPRAPIYREITDFLSSNPSSGQIVGFKISFAAQERLEDLLFRNREAVLTPEEKAELDTYLQLSEWFSILKARARIGALLLG